MDCSRGKEKATPKGLASRFKRLVFLADSVFIQNIAAKLYKKIPGLFPDRAYNEFRRRPTFPHGCPCSIIGPTGLNFRVRDGIGCDPRGMATENFVTC